MVYMNITAADGLQVWIKATGSALAQDDKTELKGARLIIGGTGNFSGAKGDASWTGEAVHVPIWQRCRTLYRRDSEHRRVNFRFVRRQQSGAAFHQNQDFTP
jgi:hypothetical protein